MLVLAMYLLDPLMACQPAIAISSVVDDTGCKGLNLQDNLVE